MHPNTTNTERVNKRGAGRLAGETDDRGAIVRRYLDELTREADAKGGREAVLTALRGPERGRYRTAVRHAAAGVLQYSGRGYPAAGLEAYGPELEVAGVRDDVYAWARELIDEYELIAAEHTVNDVLEAALAAVELGEEVYVISQDPGDEYGPPIVAGANAGPIARALVARRRERRQQA